MAQSLSRRPLSGRARIAALALGDTLALIVFAIIGRGSHGKATGLAALGETLSVAFPFIAGWFVAAGLLKGFDPVITAGVAPMAKRTALLWVAALPLGLALRALMLGRFSPLSFAVVTFLTNLVILVGWRSAFAWWEKR